MSAASRGVARRAAAIFARLRAHAHALARCAIATGGVVRSRLDAFVVGIRARLAVFASLQDAAARVAVLHHQVAAAQRRLVAYEEQERLLARSIHDGELVASEIVQAAASCIEETTLRTRAVTDAIMERTQEAAAATLQEARAAADRTLGAARVWIDATLEAASADAHRSVAELEREAASRIEPFRAAADRFAEDVRAMAGDMEGRIQTAAAELSAKVANFEAERDDYARGLAALIERHADTLERVTHLQADVQERLVPALNRLTAGLKASDTSWLKASPDTGSRGGDKENAAPHRGHARAATATPGGSDAPRRPLSSGEVVVNHINSFHQVKKFVRALAEVGGVETVRLLTYADGVATIGVSADCPLAQLDVKQLNGLPVEVVDATPTRLVVRLTRPSYPALPG